VLRSVLLGSRPHLENRLVIPPTGIVCTCPRFSVRILLVGKVVSTLDLG
jgi:hypothetical protein